MTFEKTELSGVSIIHFEPKRDERGYFVRTFCQHEFARAGVAFQVVQINRSLTKKRGAIRGMHFQTKPYQEDKLVQCIKGAIYDVALDVRPNSKTFGRWIGVELTSENNTALFIPQGYAHGFQVTQPDSEVEYFMSEYYSPKHASGVRCTDPFFTITWPLPIHYASTKDQTWPFVHKGKNV